MIWLSYNKTSASGNVRKHGPFSFVLYLFTNSVMAKQGEEELSVSGGFVKVLWSVVYSTIVMIANVLSMGGSQVGD